MTEKHYVAFDLETTGLHVERGHRIIEIGAIEIIGSKLGEEFHILIDTDAALSMGAQSLHGIRREMLNGQPRREEALTKFQKFIGNNILIAHNVKFDIGFLRYEYRLLGKFLLNRYECTLKLSRKFYPNLPNYKLETVARNVLACKTKMLALHRALDDAKLTAEIWLKMKETLND